MSRREFEHNHDNYDTIPNHVLTVNEEKTGKICIFHLDIFSLNKQHLTKQLAISNRIICLGRVCFFKVEDDALVGFDTMWEELSGQRRRTGFHFSHAPKDIKEGRK